MRSFLINSLVNSASQRQALPFPSSNQMPSSHGPEQPRKKQRPSRNSDDGCEGRNLGGGAVSGVSLKQNHLWDKGQGRQQDKRPAWGSGEREGHTFMAF